MSPSFRASRSGDFMWEINHPFPYDHPLLARMIREIPSWDFAETPGEMASLSAELDTMDYEYLVWSVWKEGFARFVENRIRKSRGKAENRSGNQADESTRVSFHHIGDHIWRQLVRLDGEWMNRIEAAFEVIRGDGAA